MGTKKGHLYGKGAPFKRVTDVWGSSCHKLLPLDPPLLSRILA